MMKKLISGILVFVMLSVTLTGCSKFVRGTWQDNTFTNTFAGIEYTLPDGWVASTEEQLAQQMQLSVDLVSDDKKYQAELLKKQSIMDMVSTNTATKSNVIIMFENLSVSFGTNITEEEYGNLVKTQLLEQGKKVGYDYEFNDVTTEYTLGGNIYQAFSTTIKGTNMEQHYLFRKDGKFIIALIISLNAPETLDEVLLSFKK